MYPITAPVFCTAAMSRLSHGQEKRKLYISVRMANIDRYPFIRCFISKTKGMRGSLPSKLLKELRFIQKKNSTYNSWLFERNIQS